MSARDFTALLEDAAHHIADISRADLQIMLRRAALRLRNAGAVSMEDDVEDALRNLANELGMTRNDMIRFIVREWMERNTYLPMQVLDEDGDHRRTPEIVCGWHFLRSRLTGFLAANLIIC
ncbi:ribbon-helix-helix protein, CopG family [Rhizobium indicum]|nr:ribbon-helix-helix protein, CopG family [Rhizobium indicum]